MASARTKGIDASCVQGLLPCQQLKAQGVEFAILKSYEGNKTKAQAGLDPCFEANVRACLANGIEPFAYAFAYPLPEDGINANRSARDQAWLHVQAVCRYPELAQRPLFLDLEWPAPGDWKKWWPNAGSPAKAINAWCREYVEAVFEFSGVRPILYTYPWWWQALIAAGCDVSWAAEYGLWLASYPEKNRWPLDTEHPLTMPKPWLTWTFWQFDGDGGMRLPNNVDADFCLYNGSLEQLCELAGWSPARQPDAA